MNWHVTTYIVTIAASIAVMAGLAIYSWRHRHLSGASTFFGLCLLGAWGALVEFLSMVSGSPFAAGLFYDARFVTLSGIPVMWLIFTIQYSGHSARINPRFVILLFIIPVVTQIILWTNGLHGLWLVRDVEFYHVGPFLVADTTVRVPGPWFMVHVAYGYASLILGVFIILHMSLRLIRFYRGQSLALVGGTIIMMLGSSLPTFNLLPHLRVNPITQSLALGALFFAWAIFRHRFLDMIPVARDNLTDSMDDGMLVVDMSNRIVDINRSMIALLREALGAEGRVLPKKIIGQPVMEVLYPWRNQAALFRDETNITTEVEVMIAGDRRYLDIRLTPIIDRFNHNLGRMMVLRDITRFKLEENTQKMVIEILDILNHEADLRDAVGDILSAIKRGTGFDAVGIRLKKDDDYPYFVQNGFSDDFLLTENSLTMHQPDGGFCRDRDGKVSLECTCGLVISGKTDPENPLFTRGGSAWTNDSFPILDIPAEEDPRLNPRNLCIHAGFRSIALVPIRVNKEIVGLLQLNDRRKDRFTLEMIRFYEGLTASIGVTLLRKRSEEALRESEARYRLLIENLYDIIYSFDPNGAVTYISPSIKHFGYEADDILGRNILDFISADDRAMVADTFTRALEKGEDPSLEMRMIRKDGEIAWMWGHSHVIRDLDGNAVQIVGILKDFTDRKLAENIIQARLRMIEYAVNHSLGELLQNTLDEVCAITNSPIGFYHFVEPDQVTLSLQAWSTITKKDFCTAEGEGLHYPVDAAGVWVDCIHQRKPVIHNDYASLPHRKGLPEGHAHMVRELVVPILRKEKIVAILGIGNKAQDYTDKDTEIVTYFADVGWEISTRKRTEDALRNSEFALRERNSRMEDDLKIAQRAQKGIIQGIKPACKNLGIEFRYKPMEKVGGDYFSFLSTSDESLGFFIGDVAGHGLASALFIALLKSSTDRMFREYGKEPSVYLKNLNGELVDYMSSYFVTGIYGVFDSCGCKDDMSLKFSIGGHPKPLLIRKNGSTTFTGLSGNIIGIPGTVDYTTNEEALSKGDRIFVYTDGIPETINKKKKMIGFDEGLVEIFERSKHDSLSETLDAVMEEIHRFRGVQPLQDDITLIGFEVV